MSGLTAQQAKEKEMSKRTVEEEVKYQEELKQADMRTAFVVFYDLMRARDIEYPFAVVWQTLNEEGEEDFTVMVQSDKWDMDHGPVGSGNPAEIVNDNIDQDNTQPGKYNIQPRTTERAREILSGSEY